MAIICPQCQKTFSKKSNLTRHLKANHENENGVEERKAQCILCNSAFKRNDHLKSHIDAVHFAGEPKQCSLCSYSTTNKSLLKRHIHLTHKNKQSSQAKPQPHQCSICDSKFTLRTNLNYHLKTKHNILPANLRMLEKKCPLCPFKISDKTPNNLKKQMLEHFFDNHNIEIEIETHHFSSVSEFDAWKANIEIDTYSRYIKKDYHQQLKSTFVCHRNGLFKTKSSGKRSLKIMGSCKINGFCPASITSTIEKTGSVSVEFVKTHIGHKPELKHLPLTQEERKDIAMKLAGKIPHDEILREIRDSVTNSQLKRIHLLTKKDIHNIERSFNLSDVAVRPPYTDALELSVGHGLSKPNKNDDDISEAKEAFITDLISTLRNGITNSNQLTAIKNHCKSIGPMLKSMEERSLQLTNVSRENVSHFQGD